jgi:uncharacterized protein YjiS (DUF1127 family)
MISAILDRPKAPPSSARLPKHESVPQMEAPSLACADIAQDRPWPSRNPEGSALAIVEGMFALVRVWRECRRTRRQLAIMSERELQDIGTCRSEIAYEIAKPFWMALAVSNAAR